MATSMQTIGTQDFSPEEIERLQGHLDGTTHDGILDGDFTPLIEYILTAPIPDRLKLPKVNLFDWAGDPSNHQAIYFLWARAYGYSDAIKCRLFDTTLVGKARRWWY